MSSLSGRRARRRDCVRGDDETVDEVAGDVVGAAAVAVVTVIADRSDVGDGIGGAAALAAAYAAAATQAKA